MFGFVVADFKELNKEQKQRYQSIYCGICHRIREQSGQACRLALSYDMAFLAMVLMSLYEPQETLSQDTCVRHPVKGCAWVDNRYISYAADMNVVLGYYKALDDWQDEKKRSAKWFGERFGKHYPQIAEKYPRQCEAVARCLDTLRRLEQENCDNADKGANCFGELMGELLVYQEDLWASALQEMGRALGRFIYLADAAVDYPRDKRKGQYNPYLAMGMEENWDRWEQYLVLEMERCTRAFEKLPLVQDKKILDNILYSGVWCCFAGKKKKKREERE